MAFVPPPRRPWFLIGLAAVQALLLVSVVVGAYVPARQQLASLEAEVRAVYRKEADLQARLEEAHQAAGRLQKQLNAVSSERDALVLRIRELERALLKR